MTSMQLALAVSSAVAVGLASTGARAATATSNFTVQVTITASCTIVSTATLNFGGSVGVLTANVDVSTTLQVQCTNTTPYNIGLNAGIGTGATVASRLMTSGANTITYSLYKDSGHVTVWGNTVGIDTQAATGTGAAQTYTVYGRIPPQTTPAPATYSDTITVTVTY
jgi:spore coat protein U-like protein